MSGVGDSGKAPPGHRSGGTNGSARHTRNTSVSVSARLLTIAHERGDEFQLILMRYGLERLLYRLGHSAYVGRFVVKGAMLFTLWAQEISDESSEGQAPHAYPLPASHRATHDLDLLDFNSGDLAQIERVFRDLCLQSSSEDDGLHFLSETVHADAIRADQKYGGVRVRLLAMLGKARIPLQIDIGFGDVVTPAPVEAAFPILLPELSAPQVRVYPRETVVAEKFEAMVRLGMLNTRLKDFYDLWILANQFTFDGPSLSAALSATFKRRGTALPETAPVALTSTFSSDSMKQMQWAAFMRKGRVSLKSAPEFPAVVSLLQTFLLAPSYALTQ